MSLLPARYNFACWQGATWDKVITWMAGTPAAPVDVTGYTGVLDIRTAPDQPPFLSLTTANGGITMGGTAGTVSLYMAASATLTVASGVYELLVTDAAGTGDTFGLLWGQFTARGLV